MWPTGLTHLLDRAAVQCCRSKAGKMGFSVGDDNLLCLPLHHPRTTVLSFRTIHLLRTSFFVFISLSSSFSYPLQYASVGNALWSYRMNRLAQEIMEGFMVGPVNSC